MDYQRIYDQFIADRRLRFVSGYVERHHIIPSSVGGSDEVTNLIDLSPEDHFFAHLLLAKIHGGMMWVPVVMWLGGERRSWVGRRSRLQYGWASRAARIAVGGSGAHQFDHEIYSLEHKSGKTFSGTQYDIARQLQLTKAGVCLLVNRKMPSLRGWFFPDNRPAFIGRGSRKGRNHPMAVPTKHHFRHIDGSEFVGTQYEMHLTHGISKAAACTLASGKRSVSKGWYIVGRPPKKLGRAAHKAQVAEAKRHSVQAHAV